MRLKAFKELGDKNPIIAEVSVVVVEGDDGTPVMVACDVGNGGICASSAKDEDFNRVLRTLGIDKLVITDNLDAALKPPGELPAIFGGK